MIDGVVFSPLECREVSVLTWTDIWGCFFEDTVWCFKCYCVLSSCTKVLYVYQALNYHLKKETIYGLPTLWPASPLHTYEAIIDRNLTSNFYSGGR